MAISMCSVEKGQIQNGFLHLEVLAVFVRGVHRAYVACELLRAFFWWPLFYFGEKLSASAPAVLLTSPQPTILPLLSNDCDVATLL